MSGTSAGDAERPGRLLPLMAGLLLAEVVGALEASMVVTAIPAISRDAGLPAMGWLLSAFMLAYAGTAAIGGRFGDMFGRRNVLIVILVLSMAGSLISALAQDVSLIIFGRAIQGASGAIVPLCLGIARQHVSAIRLPFWIGILSGGYAGSGALGYALGGYVAEEWGWRYLFYLTSVLPLLAIAIILLLIPRDPKRDKGAAGLDYAGLLFVPGITGLLLAITNMGRTGPATGTLLILAGSVAVLAFWTRYELRAATPLLDIRLLVSRNMLLTNMAGVLLGMGALQIPVVMMLYLQQPISTGVGLGVGAALAGIIKIPSSAIAVIASPAAGLIAARHDSRKAALLGCAACLAALAAFATHLGDVLFVILASTVSGFGVAVMLAALNTLVVAQAPMERTSEAAGLAAVIRAIGNALGPQLVVAVLAWSAGSGNREDGGLPAEAFKSGFTALLIVACLMSVAVLAIRVPAAR